MVHQGQGLAFSFKAGDNLPCVHASFDDLESNLTADGLLLFSKVNDAAAAFANLAEELVTSDHIAGLFEEGQVELAGSGEAVEGIGAAVMRGEERSDFLAQEGVGAASGLEISLALGFSAEIEGGIEEI